MMTLKDLLRLTKLPLLILLIFLRILLSVFNVFISVLIQWGINYVMNVGKVIALESIGILMIGGSLLFIILYYAYNYLILDWITEINLHIGEKLIENLLERNRQERSKFSEGKMLNLMSYDMEAISNFLKYGLLPLVDMLITLLAGLIYVFFGSYLIGFVFLFSGLIVLKINQHHSRQLATDLEEYTEHSDRYLSELEKIYQTIPIMRTTSRRNWISKQFGLIFDHKRTSYQDYYDTYSKIYSTTEGSIGILEILVLILGLWMVYQGQILFGTMIGIWNAGLGSILYPLGTLPDYLSFYHQYKVSSLRMKDYYQSILRDESSSRDFIYREAAEDNILLDSIGFSHQDQVIFNNFTAVIPGKGITFISGGSGKGKSTLFHLLMNELKVDSGQIIFEGQFNPPKISFVPQKNQLFSVSILDNLKLLNPSISDEEVKERCKQVNIFEDIHGLPAGFDTKFQGNLLSNGQRRRLSIARALLNKSNYVFLDEPFSDLDVNNQQLIMNVLKDESHQRGIVIISHTNDFFQYADQHIKVGDLDD